jgi:hypothetical protein
MQFIQKQFVLQIYKYEIKRILSIGKSLRPF